MLLLSSSLLVSVVGVVVGCHLPLLVIAFLLLLLLIVGCWLLVVACCVLFGVRVVAAVAVVVITVSNNIPLVNYMVIAMAAIIFMFIMLVGAADVAKGPDWHIG